MARKRVYLFGIGSPAHQRKHGYVVRGPHGTPVSTGRSRRRVKAVDVQLFSFDTLDQLRRPSRRRKG